MTSQNGQSVTSAQIAEWLRWQAGLLGHIPDQFPFTTHDVGAAALKEREELRAMLREFLYPSVHITWDRIVDRGERGRKLVGDSK